ncbi:MAG: phosphoribosylglycinamide formyltransferase [Gammaproteobacteria bacterium]
MMSVAVLASGRGSNLQALIDAAARPGSQFAIRCVVSDRADAGALARAHAAGIPAHFIDPAIHADRASFDAALDAAFAGHDLTVLAGFMRVLGSALVQKWAGRMVNVHPSLLPKYRGLNTHQRALDASDTEHGASVHFVTETLDSGPVILQAVIPVNASDDAATLAARVQAQEHRIYPFVVGLFAQGRVALVDGVATLDGKALAMPLRVDADTDLECIAA